MKKAAALPPPILLRSGGTARSKASGTDIMLEFVDPTMTGEYRMTMDPSEKDALMYVPGAGLTMWEQMGLARQGGPLQPHRRHSTWERAISRSPAA